MRKPYPSDISREAFKEIKPLLLSGRKQTRPRVVDVYEVFCALLYILKSGCQWSMLPRDFSPKSAVHYYFSIWNKKSSETEPSILEQALKNVVGEARISIGRKEQRSFIMIDSQSVKNTDTARDKGYVLVKKFQALKDILLLILKVSRMEYWLRQQIKQIVKVR